MCRLMCCITGHGDAAVLLADVVLWPDRSIIKQSYDARERKGDPALGFHLAHGALNADGFGIGWFSTEDRRARDPTPCVFTSVTPAWNNENLARLACKIVSPIIFAHVRAAYPGMPVSEQNCHPFMFGRYLWMHNGVVAGFAQIKRHLLSMLSDVAYNSIQSFHSDSAISFALFLHHLPNPFSQQPPETLLKAMQDTIHTLSRLQAASGISGTSLLNYVVSDGTCVVATRFVSPATADAASLYYAEGASFTRSSDPANPAVSVNKAATAAAAAGTAKDGAGCGTCCTNGTTASSSSILHEASYDLNYGELGARMAFIASEPITGSSAAWVSVPKNVALVASREKGGFINILRCPLTQSAEEEQQQATTAASRPPSVVGGAGTISKALAGPHMLTSQASQGYQLEVARCLEAISRGLAAKSRPWVATAHPTLRGAEVMLADGQAAGLGVQATRANSMALSTLPSRHHSQNGTDSTNKLIAAALGTSPDAQPLLIGAAPGAPSDPLMNPEQGEAAGVPHFQRLVGHSGGVLSMALSEEAQMLYTGGIDCTIKMWSLADNRCLGSVTVGRNPVTSLQLRGRWLLSSSGRKLRVWDTQRHCTCVAGLQLPDHCGVVRCLLAAPGRVYLGCQDASIRCFMLDEAAWHASAADPTQPKPDIDGMPAAEPHFATPVHHGHVGQVNALVASSNGELIISAAGDAMIRVWRARDLSHVRTLRGHRGSVLSLLVIENLLVSGARDNTIRVWDLDMDMMCRCTLTGHKDDVTHLAAVTLRTCCYATYKAPGGSSGGGSTTSQPQATAVLPCTVVASASADGTVRLWSLTWTCLCVLVPPSLLSHWTPPTLPTEEDAAALASTSGYQQPPPSPRTTNSGTSTFAAVTEKPTEKQSDKPRSTSATGRTVNGLSSGLCGCAPSSLVDRPVPPVLCTALTSRWVCAAYGDGEVRLWPCEGVHLLALQLVANDLGLTSHAESILGSLQDIDGAPASLPRTLLTSPSMASPPALSPYHPLFAMLNASGNAPTSFPDTTTMGQLPTQAVGTSPTAFSAAALGGTHSNGTGTKLTLSQANLQQLVSVFSSQQHSGHLAQAAQSGSNASSNVAAAAAAAIQSALSAAAAAASPSGLATPAPVTAPATTVAVSGVPMTSSSPTPSSTVGVNLERQSSSSTHTSTHANGGFGRTGLVAGSPDRTSMPVVRSSGSHHLDNQMRQSVSELLTASALASGASTPRTFLTGGFSPPELPGSLVTADHPPSPRAFITLGGAIPTITQPNSNGRTADSSIPSSVMPPGSAGHISFPDNGNGWGMASAPQTIMQPQPPGHAAASAMQPAASLLTQQLELHAERHRSGRISGSGTAPSTGGGASYRVPHPPIQSGSMQVVETMNREGSGTDGRAGSTEVPPQSAVAHLDLAGRVEGGEFKGAFGSFMGIEHMEHLAKQRLLGSAHASRQHLAGSHTSSTALASWEETPEHQSLDGSTTHEVRPEDLVLEPASPAVKGPLGQAAVHTDQPGREASLAPDGYIPEPTTRAVQFAEHVTAYPPQKLPSRLSQQSPLADVDAGSTGHMAAVIHQTDGLVQQLSVHSGGLQHSSSVHGGVQPDPAVSLQLAAAELSQQLAAVEQGQDGGTAGEVVDATGAISPKSLGLAPVAIRPKTYKVNVLHAALEQYLNRPSVSGLGWGVKSGPMPGAATTTDIMMESCLREFVRIPTVSSNPRLREECVRGAKFLAKLLESLGTEVKIVRPFEDKNPIVIGRLGHDPEKATVCFYGHYDVQPAQEPDWRTNPFELSAVNEYLYGRGTSDNKGPILAFIFAVKELLDEVDADGTGACSMPVNIVFIFEGEEENGSIGFREAVTQNLNNWFKGVQLVIISNTNWVGESVPCLTYGMRGMISVSVSVSGPQRDVHSGNDGGVFCEPMMDLISVMSTVMQPGSNNIKVPGFMDQVAPGLVDLAWCSLQQHGQGEFSRDGYQAQLGVPALTPAPGAKNLLEARWCKPSLSIVDLRPTTAVTSANERSMCYRFGPTRFSVIPHAAVAKISIRFVARQDPKHIISCLRNHVHAEFQKLGSPNRISVHVDALGNWWEADVRSKWMMMAEAAIRRAWGCEPLYVREGGTMPVASVLERLLGAPALMVPMGQSSDSPHLANERIRRLNLIKGKGVIRALLEEVAGLWVPGTPSASLATCANAHANAMPMGCCPLWNRNMDSEPSSPTPTPTHNLTCSAMQTKVAQDTGCLGSQHVGILAPPAGAVQDDGQPQGHAHNGQNGQQNGSGTTGLQVDVSGEGLGEVRSEDVGFPATLGPACGAVREESPFQMIGQRF